MNIASLFSGDVVTTAQNSGSVFNLNSSSENFLNIMNNIETNQSKKVESASKIESHKDNFQQNSKSKDKNNLKAKSTSVNVEEDKNLNYNMVNSTDNKEVQITEVPNKEVEYEDIIKDISDTLGLEEQVVVDILNLLNFTALDLKDKSNLNLFMQKVFTLEEQVDLLDIPNISEIIKNVSCVLENISELQVNFEEDDIKNLLNDDVKILQKPQNETTNYMANNIGKNIQVATDLNEENNIEILKESEKTVKILESINYDSSNSSQDSLNESENQNLSNTLGNVVVDLDTEVVTEFKVIENISLDANTTVTQSVTKVKSTGSVNPKEVINQIVNKMTVEFKSNVSEIKITLNPETLGSVSLKISTQNGMVAAQFLAENQKIKEIIESNFEQLKDSLQKQGIEVSELSVSVRQEQNEAMMNQFNQSRQKSSRRIQQIINGLNAEEEQNDYSDLNLNEALNSTVSYRA